MALIVSNTVKAKLASKHRVSEEEVEQAFANRMSGYLLDTREEHQSDPPTMWFIAETDYGRKLKVAFIQRDDDTYLRTAYEANPDELRIYNKYAQPL